MKSDYRKLMEDIHASLRNSESSGALSRAVVRGRGARKAQFSRMADPERFVSELKEIKTEANRQGSALTDMFVDKCRENGCFVKVAGTGKEVIEYVAGLASSRGAKLVSKSKSLTTEEIEFNRLLEEKGLEVVETDLGERIIQLAGEKPFHLVFPAIHRSQSSIAKLFTESFGYDVPDDLAGIMKAIRKEMRPVFFGTDIGVNGANVAVAETGTVIIETNEGNDRMVNSIPDVQVVVVGMEKIVPSWDDAVRLINAHPLSATGTPLTNYVSMISNRLDFEGKSREMHVLILDNGRSRMRADPDFSEALNCIRCGACMNICPTYGTVGGHVFGHIYPGPIGIPWTMEIHGVENAKFSHLCISCGLCQTVCPAGIDIPLMIARVKEKDVSENGQLFINRFMCSMERMSGILSATAPVSNWIVGNRFSRYVEEKLIGIDRKRELPKYTRHTFSRQFAGMEHEQKGGEKVIYFPDMFADLVKPEIGMGSVRLLGNAGAHVTLPGGLVPSGAPFFLYGELKKARKAAMRNVSILHPFVEKGYEIVSTEPTATYSLRKIYPELLGGSRESMEVSRHTHEMFEYLAKRGASLFSRPEGMPDRLGFHIPCHERPLSSGSYAVKALEMAGYSVTVIESGTCCGMAGTFGLKKGALGADLSRAVAAPLVEMFRSDRSIQAIATESSVCSMQLGEGVGLRVYHPVELLQPRPSGSGSAKLN